MWRKLLPFREGWHCPLGKVWLVSNLGGTRSLRVKVSTPSLWAEVEIVKAAADITLDKSALR